MSDGEKGEVTKDQKLRRFLELASGDPEGGWRGKHHSHEGDPGKKTVLENVDNAFREVREGFDFPQGPWPVTKEVCDALLAWMTGLADHGHPAKSPPHDQIYLAIRFAMPLVPTAESEDVAAG